MTTNIERAAAVLREHLGAWLDVNPESLPPDEFDCCARALAKAGLLAPDDARVW